MPIQNNMKQKVYKNAIYSVHGPTLKGCLYTQRENLGENQFCLCNQMSTADSFLFRSKNPFLLPPLNARTSCDLNL